MLNVGRVSRLAKLSMWNEADSEGGRNTGCLYHQVEKLSAVPC